MDIIEGCFYHISDKFFLEVNEPSCWRRAEQPLKGRRKTTNFGQTKKPTTQFTQFIFIDSLNVANFV